MIATLQLVHKIFGVSFIYTVSLILISEYNKGRVGQAIVRIRI